MKNIILSTLLLLLIIMVCSCKKMIVVDSPKNQLTTDKVFADSTSACAALLNSYSLFENNFDPVYNNYVGLYTDEFILNGSDRNNDDFYKSRLNSANNTNQSNWSYLYGIIYQCNDVIFQLRVSNVLSRTLIIRLTSEARFLRAYAYFHLVNLYGNVPLLLQTDVSITAIASRVAQDLVYDQMIQDLSLAKESLPVSYIGAGKVRANKWAASALLSRIFLYQKNWALAEKESSDIINSNLYTPLVTIPNVFKANSREAILQFWNQNGYISNSVNTLPSSSTSLPQYLISPDLYNAFEDGDLRKVNWVGKITLIESNVDKNYYYNNKYKNRSANTSNPEYLMVFRIAEQFLIRAEARAMLGNINGAVDDLNTLRQRAGIRPLTSNINRQECLDNIIKERRLEFFAENGHRFFDLKRTNRIHAVMQAYKPTWLKDVSGFWPIPQNEITYNRNLIQNLGY